MKQRSIAGAILAVGISGVLAFGAGVLPASADDGVPADEVVQAEGYRWALSPADAVIQPGESVTYTATLVDLDGVPADPQPAVAPYIGTDAGGDIEDGFTITAFSPGPRAVMAVAVIDGEEYFGGTSLTVVGEPVSLEITPSAASVDQGGTLTFAISGVDAWGTPIDTSSASLTSSVASDVVDGLSVRFPTASPHTITARLGELAASVTVQVDPATVAGSSSGATLAETGVDGNLVGIVGAALLLVGAGLVLARRRTTV
ncbi:LPXTG cell wall anchor domain-containing protein [Agromyces subbeticus]|uniref:LPXTG cell wall anchor domain-containing protein n=1 Tax=Agromyces subbeticus TaxID=293890 RepID=UPI0003B56873|nr:LPXTG cell wall anchor domain-containing protein [Agromyces subbeticus]